RGPAACRAACGPAPRTDCAKREIGRSCCLLQSVRRHPLSGRRKDADYTAPPHTQPANAVPGEAGALCHGGVRAVEGHELVQADTVGPVAVSHAVGVLVTHGNAAYDGLVLCDAKNFLDDIGI